jgi:hypothetical protein
MRNSPEPIEGEQPEDDEFLADSARGMLEFYADPTRQDHRPEFDPNGRTIPYGASGARSALTVETLQQLSYTDVAHLEGRPYCLDQGWSSRDTSLSETQPSAASPSSFSTMTQSRQ